MYFASFLLITKIHLIYKKKKQTKLNRTSLIGFSLLLPRNIRANLNQFHCIGRLSTEALNYFKSFNSIKMYIKIRFQKQQFFFTFFTKY